MAQRTIVNILRISLILEESGLRCIIRTNQAIEHELVYEINKHARIKRDLIGVIQNQTENKMPGMQNFNCWCLTDDRDDVIKKLTIRMKQHLNELSMSLMMLQGQMKSEIEYELIT